MSLATPVFVPKTASSSLRQLLGCTGERALHVRAVDLLAKQPDAALYAVVRNPYDRAVSIWRHTQEHWHQCYNAYRGLSLAQFIEQLQLARARGDKCPINDICSTQTYWLCDEAEERLLPKRLFRFENLAELEAFHAHRLPHNRPYCPRQPKIDYHKVYAQDRDAIKRVEDHFRKDFELLGYKMEDF